MAIQSPKDLFELLARNVIDQQTTLEQVSVSLYKHVQGLKVGNLMLIGNSGTGKTTVMRTIEKVFSEDPDLAGFTNIIRMNANLVASEEGQQIESNIILERLQRNALLIMGDHPDEKRFKSLMEHGVVFLDEVDKIRSQVGDKANARGILAQEALLTLIEGEKISLPLTLRHKDGNFEEKKVEIDTNRLLFICGGAFEGLYDMVYRRVASGEHRDKLVQEYVISEGANLEEKEHFSLQGYLRYEDMFAYGMTPQFLGRFDEIIVLDDLSIKGLKRIFVEPQDSPFREARRYFASLGIDLQVTREALDLIAERAHENHRLGARALKMVFKRVLRGIEFNPTDSYLLQDRDGRKILTLTKDVVSNYS